VEKPGNSASMKIYTKTGDDGETGLFGGPRVRKDHPRIAAYGEIDELNAALGLARASGLVAEIDQTIDRVQHELFAVGSELATPDPARHGTRWIGGADVAALESDIDRWQRELAPLRNFILPGGSHAAALLHLARCICRRAERNIVALAANEPVAANLLAYVNRLSDLLFVLARATNHTAGVADVLWRKPS
jgi:cob(I)alamin adenosyltransferase